VSNTSFTPAYSLRDDEVSDVPMVGHRVVGGITHLGDPIVAVKRKEEAVAGPASKRRMLSLP
jgi:hypothetical protein